MVAATTPTMTGHANRNPKPINKPAETPAAGQKTATPSGFVSRERLNRAARKQATATATARHAEINHGGKDRASGAAFPGRFCSMAYMIIKRRSEEQGHISLKVAAKFSFKVAAKVAAIQAARCRKGSFASILTYSQYPLCPHSDRRTGVWPCPKGAEHRHRCTRRRSVCAAWPATTNVCL